MNPVPNPMTAPFLASEDQDDLTMAGEEDVHDYSEAEINGMWREYVIHVERDEFQDEFLCPGKQNVSTSNE